MRLVADFDKSTSHVGKRNWKLRFSSVSDLLTWITTFNWNSWMTNQVPTPIVWAWRKCKWRTLYHKLLASRVIETKWVFAVFHVYNLINTHTVLNEFILPWIILRLYSANKVLPMFWKGFMVFGKQPLTCCIEPFQNSTTPVDDGRVQSFNIIVQTLHAADHRLILMQNTNWWLRPTI